jgi:sigma-B regulation protein RsbU (phosphoserine phosphatase)
MKAVIGKTGIQMVESSGLPGRLTRWFLIVLLVWGIPSFIFWTGAKLYLDDRTSQESQKIYNDLDYRLDNYIYQSSAQRFYQPGFSRLFGQLKGLPSNQEILEKIIDEYKSTWPKGLLEIYLFDGKNKIYPMKGARPEHELFFKLVNSEFDKGAGISPEDVAEVGKFLPSPDLSLTYTREQNGKVIKLGNPDRFSYCYFDRDKSINKGFVAGILIFVHGKNISTSEILNLTISQADREQFGFVNSDGQSNLPGLLKDLSPEELLAYFQQYPVNSFKLEDNLISLKRFDEYTLLVGASMAPEQPYLLIATVFILFLIFSFAFIRLSYRITVLQIRFQHNVRQRLTGLFALCYALPLLAAAFLAMQYMLELRHSLTSEVKHENYRRLAEIDSGFNRFITAKLLDLRSFSSEMQKSIDDPKALKAKIKKLYQRFEADSAHLIASDSELIYTTDLLTAEIRRHYLKSRQDRQKILESWKARHAKLSDKHIQMLFSSSDNEGMPIEPEISEGHMGFVRLFRSTALSAMEFYNKTRGISVPIRRSSSNLVIDTIIESNTQSLFQSARTNISRFTNIQGMNEIFLAYLDVLAGPQKEAWYAFALLIDLVNYERQYLERLYSDLRSRSEIMNKVFPEEDIRAFSNHQFAANFPSVFEFKNFEAIIKRSSNDFKTFTQQLKVDGQESLVSVLKASYLKHYLLIKVVPLRKIDEIFYERLNLILIFFLALVIIGLALARLLTQLFIIPIDDIMTGVKALAARDYDYRIPVRSANEFGVLANAFNDSATILKNLAISEKIRKNLYPETEFRCGSYLITTANSNSRIILSDFFDYFPLKHGAYAVILAEVSGNDISAAYLTAMLKTSFTLLCPCFPANPELILEKLNQIFVPYYEKGHLTTCFIGLIDPTNDTMTCSNAGQSYPICIGTGDSQEKSFISLPSTPLGLNADTTFRKHQISLENKVLVLYSDGAVNLTDHEGKRIGHDRFIEIVAASISRDTRNPSEEVIKKLNATSMSLPWRDDITVLTIQNRI